MEEKFPVKRYPFRFSPLITSVLALSLFLCAACFGLSLWQFLDFLRGDLSSIYDWIKYALLFLVSIFGAVIVISMLCRSQYCLTEKELIMQFGIIKSRYEIKKIFSLQLLNGSKKLAVYFDDFKTKYMIIVVKEMWIDDFIKALLERKPGIEFSFSTAEDENQKPKQK